MKIYLVLFNKSYIPIYFPRILCTLQLVNNCNVLSRNWFYGVNSINWLLSIAHTIILKWINFIYQFTTNYKITQNITFF